MNITDSPAKRTPVSAVACDCSTSPSSLGRKVNIIDACERPASCMRQPDFSGKLVPVAAERDTSLPGRPEQAASTETLKAAGLANCSAPSTARERPGSNRPECITTDVVLCPEWPPLGPLCSVKADAVSSPCITAPSTARGRAGSYRPESVTAEGVFCPEWQASGPPCSVKATATSSASVNSPEWTMRTSAGQDNHSALATHRPLQPPVASVNLHCSEIRASCPSSSDSAAPILSITSTESPILTSSPLSVSPATQSVEGPTSKEDWIERPVPGITPLTPPRPAKSKAGDSVCDSPYGGQAVNCGESVSREAILPESFRQMQAIEGRFRDALAAALNNGGCARGKIGPSKDVMQEGDRSSDELTKPARVSIGGG